MFVAHAAPATPIGAKSHPSAANGILTPKISSGSRTRLAPNPTIMHIIERMAPPSARWSAESPKARCEKRCEQRTIWR